MIENKIIIKERRLILQGRRDSYKLKGYNIDFYVSSNMFNNNNYIGHRNWITMGFDVIFDGLNYGYCHSLDTNGIILNSYFL